MDLLTLAAHRIALASLGRARMGLESTCAHIAKQMALPEAKRSELEDVLFILRGVLGSIVSAAETLDGRRK
jgi:hypothetical protein